MKKTFGKIIALVAVFAIVACFTFALVACNDKNDNVTTNELTAKEAEQLLFDSANGAFRITGAASNVKVVFSEKNNGAVVRAGEAAEYYVEYGVLFQNGEDKTGDVTTTYSNITTKNGDATSNVTYYLAYEYDEESVCYYGPYYLLREDGVVEYEGYENDVYGDPIYNECRANSGLNDANTRIENIKDAVKNDDDGTITYAATEYYNGETYSHTIVTATYSYTDASGKVEGTATIKVVKSDYVKGGDEKNGNVISSVSFDEGTYSYSATYTFNIGEIEVPMTAEDWVAEYQLA